MIAFLSGKLMRKATDHLIVDVGGVGYQVHIPLSTYCTIPETGEEVCLHIHTHLREDSLSLFGFLTQEEKEMFLLLMGVSGIGPKLALAVLSSIPVEDLCSAIHSSDDSRLCSIPGIGKKTAARMVLELRDKIKQRIVPDSGPQATAQAPDALEDVVSALVNLGYKKPQAEETVRKIQRGRPAIAVEEMLRHALSILTKR